MDLDNVAMLIAPNLFYNLPQDPGMDQLTLAKGTTHVMKLLIKYHQLLWTVSLNLQFIVKINVKQYTDNDTIGC